LTEHGIAVAATPEKFLCGVRPNDKYIPGISEGYELAGVSLSLIHEEVNQQIAICMVFSVRFFSFRSAILN